MSIFIFCKCIINFFDAHALRTSSKLLPQARFAKTQLLQPYIIIICIKCVVIPKIWVTPCRRHAERRWTSSNAVFLVLACRHRRWTSSARTARRAVPYTNTERYLAYGKKNWGAARLCASQQSPANILN